MLRSVATLIRPCLTFPEESCLLPTGPEREWTCCVCRTVTDWLEAGFDRILVREFVHGKDLVCVFPGRSAEDAPEDCVLTMGAGTHSREDIRITLNTLLAIADEVWIWNSDPAPHSMRLKP